MNYKTYIQPFVNVFIHKSQNDGKIKFDYYWIGVIAVILGFIIYKWGQLNIPYFGDEAWVYAPALQKMCDNGLSLLPNALPVELSRGHPLLFHFLGGAWLKIFGTSFTANHGFALFISVCLLLSIYIFAKEFFSRLVGLISVLFMVVQPLFIVQSSMLYPEILVALFTIITLFAFLKERKLLYVIMGTMLLMTKESGVVLIFALFIWLIFKQVYFEKKKLFEKKFILENLYLIYPLLLIFVYFLIQRTMLGWFFYPEHTDYMDFAWVAFYQKFNISFATLFEDQGRYMLTIGAIISVIFFWKEINKQERLILAVAMLVMVTTIIEYHTVENYLIRILSIIVMILLFRNIFIRFYHYDEKSGNVFVIFGLFGLFYVIFSSLNFHSVRYLISLMPVFIMLSLHYIYKTLEKRKILMVVLVALALINVQQQLQLKDKIAEWDLSYYEIIETQQQLINYCEENNMYEERMFAGFFTRVNFSHEYAGYLSTNRVFHHMSSVVDDGVDWCIFTNAEYDPLIEQLKLENRIELVKSFKKGKTWLELYRHIKQNTTELDEN